MNRKYQRLKKLQECLVPEARTSWQLHPDQECRGILFERYMYLYGEMEILDYELHQFEKYQGERPPMQRFDFSLTIRPPHRAINLQAMLRHSSEGVVA